MGGDPEKSAEITQLLRRVRDGDAGAQERLLGFVYADLEAIARAYVRPDASLEPRGLVHELYLRLAAHPIDATDRKHFYATAALAMRQIIADRSRRRRAAKRGGDAMQVTLTGLAAAGHVADDIAVDDALAKLEKLSARQARIVELRCLVGLSAEETAEALGLSERTVYAEWRLARAWLLRELTG
ncbi:MAG TPA: ECF-type sigma factor [Kofleriaceae bacterium]|jgi:RNA polymerase sigma factor (TIGR02999 family)